MATAIDIESVQRDLEQAKRQSRDRLVKFLEQGNVEPRLDGSTTEWVRDLDEVRWDLLQWLRAQQAK